MPTSTTNFGFQKPLVNNAIDADLWGGLLNTNWDDVDSILTSFVPAVGDIEINISGTNPSTKYPIATTWVLTSVGRTLVGLDSTDPDFDTAEETGGAKEVALTAAQNGPHSHTVSAFSNGGWSNFGWKIATDLVLPPSPDTTLATTTSGSGDPHNNLQPYYVVYIWKRTA